MIRFGAVVAAAAILLAACTPDTTTTTSEADATTTTESRVVPQPDSPLVAPETADPDATAEEALGSAGAFTTATEPTLFEQDAVQAIRFWLPTDIVAGTSEGFVEGPNDDIVVTVSVIPVMSFRGDPGLVPALASLGTEDPTVETAPGVYKTETDGGLHIFLWSTGDGFLVASSLSDDAAEDYLVARESERVPLTAWDAGACLYFDPGDGLPWAPFPQDAVVSCNGAHNAEVLLADQKAVAGDAYDDDAISYQRGYECDHAYEEKIGPQRDHTPTMITYMPDEDEWDRGDRYLACVVELNTNDGPQLTVGHISDAPDLKWGPEQGDCFLAAAAPDPVPCAQAHASEFIGEVVTTLGEWPDDPADVFAEACSPLVEAIPDGPATIDVFAAGIYPFAFENGERHIRCYAFAVVDGQFAEVVGSFTGVWRPLGGDAIPA